MRKTSKDVIDALHAKYQPRNIRFRYDLLDKNDDKKGELSTVMDGEVSLSAFAQIKRTAKFTIKDSSIIDWFSDRIQPIVEVKVKNEWVEYPLGVFLLSSPVREDQNNEIYREIEAYDKLVILRDDKFLERYTVTSGTNYIDAVISILQSANISKWNIEQTDQTLPTDIEFDPGTNKLKAVNKLLSAINFNQLHVDVNGFFISMPYRSPDIRSSEYIYKDDDLSVTYNGMQEELDIYDTPNSWVAVLSDPEREPLSSNYTNDNENSPTSTVNRGRTIVDFREVDNIADQSALDSYVQRIAFEASQVYGKIEFETAIMPMHDYMDIVQIDYSPLEINGKYTETSWTIPLKVGGRMRHSVRAVVNI